MSLVCICKECPVRFQTPTWVTQACLWADLDRRIKSPWQTILQKCLGYLTSTMNDYRLVDEEREKFLKAAKKFKTLTFDSV